MNIAFFASSLLSAYWNGAATYYRGIVRGLAKLGHRVTFFEPDAFERQAHRDIEPPDWAEVVVYPADETAVHAMLMRAGAADIVIKASGVGVFDDLLEAAVLDLQGPGRAVFFWDVDAPATLERVQQDAADPFRPLIPRYDAILTYGGGEPVRRAYLALGARACVPVYNGLDPDIHHPVPPEPRFAADLAFLGNRLPDREARVEEFFLAPATSLPEKRFLLGGNGWGDRRLPANVGYLGHVYTADHNALNCSCRAVLNISRESMARFGFSPATRVFEAAGAGACILTDAWEGVETFFTPGTEILVARDGAEVAEILRGLSDAQARAIGAAARLRVLRDHTYDQRARLADRVFCDALAARSDRGGFRAPALSHGGRRDPSGPLSR
jgi:spore maturation protein CgeB